MSFIQTNTMHWLDQFYAQKKDASSDPFYMSLFDSMNSAGLIHDERPSTGKSQDLAECEDPQIKGFMELLGDVKKRKFIEEHRMTSSEATAVAVYTFDHGPEEMEKNIYYVVNRSLYEKRMEDVDKYFCYIVHLLRGLRKLEKSAHKVLYRGMKSGCNFTKEDVGKEFTWDSFTSTTPNEGKASEFLSKAPSPTLFEIHGSFRGYSVRPLSNHPSEEEIIIEPGMKFKVKEVKSYIRANNCSHVVIEVLDTPPILSEAVKFFTDEEERREYQISEQDLMGYYVFNPTFINPFQTQITPELAMRVAKATTWCPTAILSLVKSPMDRKWVNVLVSASTKMYFPTLSEIKDKKALNDIPYNVNQIINNPNGSVDQQIMTLGCVPCGISTKILDPSNVPFSKAYLQTMAYVIRSDTMEIIKQARAAFPQAKIACLNMGGQDKPGGGWETGITSLEELLFMRTTLSASLEKYLYPMKNLECIYTKDVVYIRNGDNEGYRFLAPNERFSFDVVTTCAFNLKRPVYKDGKKEYELLDFTPEIEQMTRQKIRSIFSACASNGAQVLILGALGCGAFSNPPERIAMLFRQVIQEFAGVFNCVIFSILDNNPDFTRNAAYVFSELIVGQGAGQLCAATHHANLNDVSNYPHIYPASNNFNTGGYQQGCPNPNNFNPGGYQQGCPNPNGYNPGGYQQGCPNPNNFNTGGYQQGCPNPNGYNTGGYQQGYPGPNAPQWGPN